MKLAVLTLTLAGALLSGGTSQDEAAAARAIVAEAREQRAIPGMAVAVLHDNELVLNDGFGLAHAGLGAPVTEHTLFRLASVSKIVTASLTMRLVERGVVDLDRSVREYLPELPETYAGVTPRLLLGHLGGVRHYGAKDFDLTGPGGMIDLRLYPTLKDALELFVHDPLVAEPGQRFSYSTFAFTLLAAVLEAATEQPFLELLELEVTGPLEIPSLRADSLVEVIEHRSDVYEMRAGELQRAYPLNPDYKVAGGGMLSSAGDLARFGAAHFTPGFLTAETLEEMYTPQKTRDGVATTTGLGWRISTDPAGRTIVHHSGRQGGARSTLVVYREQRLAVALLSNLTGEPDDILGLATDVAATFLDR